MAKNRDIESNKKRLLETIELEMMRGENRAFPSLKNTCLNPELSE